MPHGQNATHQGHDVSGARDVPDVPSVPDVPGVPGVYDVPDVHDVQGIPGPRGGYPWTARGVFLWLWGSKAYDPYGCGGPKPIPPSKLPVIPMIPMALGVQRLSSPPSYQ